MIYMLFVILFVLCIAIILGWFDYISSEKCPKCGTTMNKKWDDENKCWIYICPVCGERIVIYG